MTFIVALISFVVERFWDGVSELRFFGWFPRYQNLLNNQLRTQSFWTSYVKLAGIIIPILLIVLLVHALLAKAAGVAAFIFTVIVLIYCLGTPNLYAQAKKCVVKNADGSETLAIEQANDYFDLNLENDNASARLTFSETFLSVANQRVFAVIFWFVILGPIGAVLYRLNALCAEDSDISDAAKVVQNVLDWVPARLLAFSYALTGNFITVTPVLLMHVLHGLNQNDTLLKACARAAFGIKEEENHKAVDPSQAISLLDRGLILWLVVLALLQIA